MKVWVAELNNETHHLVLPNDEKIHWWDSLFHAMPVTETKADSPNIKGRETPGNFLLFIFYFLFF